MCACVCVDILVCKLCVCAFICEYVYACVYVCVWVCVRVVSLAKLPDIIPYIINTAQHKI